MNRDRTAAPLWRWPIALAVLTVLGLLAALLGGDGAGRWLGWCALAAPLLVTIRVLAPGPRRGKSR